MKLTDNREEPKISREQEYPRLDVFYFTFPTHDCSNWNMTGVSELYSTCDLLSGRVNLYPRHRTTFISYLVVEISTFYSINIFIASSLQLIADRE